MRGRLFKWVTAFLPESWPFTRYILRNKTKHTDVASFLEVIFAGALTLGLCCGNGDEVCRGSWEKKGGGGSQISDWKSGTVTL